MSSYEMDWRVAVLKLMAGVSENEQTTKRHGIGGLII